ncbi:MAG: L,D-transpeptidase [Pseudolabrys sp.]
MIPRLNGLIAVVALAATVPAGSALAQYSSPPPGYRWGTPVAEADQPADRYGSESRQVQMVPDRGPVQTDPRVYRNPDTLEPMPGQPIDGNLRPPAAVGGAGAAAAVPGNPPNTVAALPPEDQPEVGEPKQLPPQFQKQLVDYHTKEPAGTIIIDTPNTFLYLVLGDGKAMRYGIGVGREGFTWAGAERVSRMAEWPDWHPPAEMIERQPYLPRFMAGGDGNPLGARALSLRTTLYRIHGTNQPSTIGTFVSSGCIRLTNRDIEDLYSRVQVGTRVVVMPGGKPPATAAANNIAPASYQQPQGGPAVPVQQGQVQAQGQAQGYPTQGQAPGYYPNGSASGAGGVSIAGPSSIPASGLPPAR